MDVNTIQPTTPTSTFAAATRTSRLTQKDFMKLLIAEMTHQDPTSPLDNQQMVQQMASLQTLESTAALTDGINNLVRVNQLSSASSLIGKIVAGADENGDPVSGKVDSVEVHNNQVVVMVQGQPISLSSVTDVMPATPE